MRRRNANCGRADSLRNVSTSALTDPVVRIVSLRLDGPETTIAILGNEIDASVRPPSPGPVLPEPDLPQFSAIDGVGREEPLADVLELTTAQTGVWV
jgi:hypothetical protein